MLEAAAARNQTDQTRTTRMLAVVAVALKNLRTRTTSLALLDLQMTGLGKSAGTCNWLAPRTGRGAIMDKTYIYLLKIYAPHTWMMALGNLT